MRTFVACELSHERIEAVVEELRFSGADIKFVEPWNRHITLKFLGEIGFEKAERVGGLLEDTCKAFLPLEVELQGVGAFPSERYVRVVWIGVISPELVELQRRVEAALLTLGFKREGGYIPHLTIGRVRSAKNKERLRLALEKLRDRRFGKAVIKEVKLKKSELTPKGPVYTDLKVVGHG